MGGCAGSGRRRNRTLDSCLRGEGGGGSNALPSRQIRFQEIIALIEQGDAVFFGHCIGKAIAEIELGGVALAFAEAGEGIDSVVAGLCGNRENSGTNLG